MFLIKKLTTGEYLFGNKMFTHNLVIARRFESRPEAYIHRVAWFGIDPDYRVELAPDFKGEYKE